MPDAMKNIGSMAGKIGGGGGPGGGGTKWGAILPAALAGFGLYGNIKGSNQRNAELARLDAAQKKWTNMSPAQLAEMVAKTEAPLSADLTAGLPDFIKNEIKALLKNDGRLASVGLMHYLPELLREALHALLGFPNRLSIFLQGDVLRGTRETEIT